MLDLIAASSQVRIREICTTVTMRKRQDEHVTKDKVSSPILKKLILFISEALRTAFSTSFCTNNTMQKTSSLHVQEKVALEVPRKVIQFYVWMSNQRPAKFFYFDTKVCSYWLCGLLHAPYTDSIKSCLPKGNFLFLLDSAVSWLRFSDSAVSYSLQSWSPLCLCTPRKIDDRFANYLR